MATKKYQILIADDTQSNLKLITEYLEASNQAYDILLAPNGEVAWHIAQTNPIDLLITDWDMPKMNGIELIKALQSHIRLKKIPIIMITGMYIESEFLYQALEEGAIDFLSKPIQKLELIARVQAAIRLHESFKIIEEQKNKELTAKVLQIQEQNSILEEAENTLTTILTDLHQIKETDLVFITENIFQLKKHLSKSIDNEHDWENFQHKLEQIHPEFLHNIRQHKDLTTHEIRFLSYLYLQMNDKEIARILNINYQSVRAYKSRLKKKLELASETSLNDWIISI